MTRQLSHCSEQEQPTVAEVLYASYAWPYEAIPSGYHPPLAGKCPEVRADLFAFPLGNGIKDMALFLHHPPLPGRSRKAGRDGGEQLPIPTRDKQIHVRSTTRKRIETHVPKRSL